MTIFHRLEDYGENHIEGKYVKLTFDTKFRKYWQCSITHNGLQEFPVEPPLHSLTAEEQQAVHEIGGLVFYFTHGEWPEGLNAFSA